MKTYLSAIALSVLMTSTAQASSIKLNVSTPILNKQFPSGSGAVYSDNAIYAIGDDSPWLFTLDTALNIKDKELIKHYPISDSGRIIKKVKPDFEAMDEVDFYGKPAFVILGSGSKAHKREWAFLITKDKTTKIERSLTPLYSQLYKAAGFSGEQKINIEGLASSDDKMFILNRGNSGPNVIFQLNKSEFMSYMEGKSNSVRNIQTSHIQLPKYKGFEATLSGAEYWPEADSLVYTASIEATGDAYNDGDILGSFVGTVPLSKLNAKGKQKLDLTDNTVPVFKNGKRVITKIESVAITKSSNKHVQGVLVSDNDDGTSELFHFDFTR